MARQNVDGFLPLDTSGTFIEETQKLSAIENFARPEPLGNLLQKRVLRFGNTNSQIIPKGTAYPEGNLVSSELLLTSYKFGMSYVLAEEDEDNSIIDVFARNRSAWLRAWTREYDRACLGTTAAPNGTTVPFESVYRNLATTQTIHGVTYTARDNITTVAANAAPQAKYDAFNAVLSDLEAGEYGDDLVVIAHPSFQGLFRGMRDATAITEAGTNTVFGLPVHYTVGAKTTSGAYNAASNGNPFLVVANRNLIIRGTGSGPEARTIAPNTTKTDEGTLLIRVYRAFAVGHPQAAAILEVTPAV